MAKISVSHYVCRTLDIAERTHDLLTTENIPIEPTTGSFEASLYVYSQLRINGLIGLMAVAIWFRLRFRHPMPRIKYRYKQD